MTARFVLLLSGVLGLAWMGSIARGVEYSHNVSFNAVGKNPWTGEGAFQYTYQNSDLQFDFDVDLPPVSADPAGAALDLFSDFLGFDLPGLGVKMGAHAEGHAGLDFGYHVNGGYLDIKYPGRSRLDFSGVDSSNNIASLAPIRINSSFDPGVTAIASPGAQSLSELLGRGYATPTTDLTYEFYSTPEFSTSFPHASAWANLNYNVAAGGYIEAKYLFDSLRKEYNFSSSGEVTLVEADPTGISVAGLPRVELFGQTIDLGVGASVTLGNPNLKVRSDGLNGDNSLHGFDSQPIVTLQGDLEKIVPAIGPFLSNSIGPIGYDLLNLAGGPRLNLYQEFTFTPDPKVRLDFSEPVRYRLSAEGEYAIGDSVTFRLGDSIDIVTLPGNTDTLTVQPTYLMDNRFHNETGVSLGAVLDIDVLELETPVGDFGPLYSDELQFNDLVKIPFYDEEFSVQLDAISVEPLTFNKSVGIAFPAGAGAASITQIGVHSVDPETGSEIWDFRYHGPVDDGGPDVEFDFQVTGKTSLVISSLTGLANRLLTADQDIVVVHPDTGLPLTVIGRDFSENAPIDLSAFTPTDLSVGMPNDPSAPRLYLPRLDIDESALPAAFDLSLDPLLGANNSVANTSTTLVIGETIFVPEPSTWVLGILGLAALCGAHGRNRRCEARIRA